MPLVSRTFDQLIDFTRTSSATFVGSNGLIQNTPQSRNLLTFTQEFDNAVWAKSNTAVTANAAVAPDGTMAADTLTASGANGTALRTFTASAVPYTFSIWLRRLTGTGNVQLTVDGTTYATVTLTTTWARFETTLTPSAGSRTAGVRIVTSGDAVYAWGAQLELASTATDYTRNFGGLFPPRFDYDPVTLAPRGLLIEEQRTNLLTYSEQFDNAAWTKSNVTATANTVASPDGATTADTLTLTNTGGFTTQSATVSATSCTLSVFMRKGSVSVFRLLIRNNTTATDICAFTYDFDTGVTALASGAGTATFTNVGGGWFRATITVTTGITSGDSILSYVYPANVTGLTGDFSYVWGAQLEAGAFATSYIPTVASQVTRTADTALIQAPNFAPWYRQSAGTLLVEYSRYQNVDPALVAELKPTSTSTSNRFNLSASATTDPRMQLFPGGVSALDTVTTYGVLPANTVVKGVLAYRSGDSAATRNGAAVTASSTTFSAPTYTNLQIGGSDNNIYGPAANNPLNGHIRSIRYYPVRLSNAQLQALTA